MSIRDKARCVWVAGLQRWIDKEPVMVALTAADDLA